MSKTTTITLSDREWTINRLPLGILRDIDVLATAGVISDDPKEAEKLRFEQYIDVVTVALQQVDPSMTRETLLQMPSDFKEFFAAYVAILRHSGMLKSDPPQAEVVNL